MSRTTFIQDLQEAITKAQALANENNEKLHIIKTVGEGFEIVLQHFDMGRKYYHGEGGKKMFFTYVKTVEPAAPATELPPHTTNDVCLEWRVNTGGFTKELLEGYPGNGGIWRAPMNIFRTILAQLGERAAEINDPVLNALCCRLALYAQSDPYDKENYDAEVLQAALSHPEYKRWKIDHPHLPG
jgi:hypothetical protein